MIENAKILIISFYPDSDKNNFRFMNIIPKPNTQSLADKFKIRLNQGMMMTMCGKIQDEFLHGIARCTKKVSQRISISFRQMKMQKQKNLITK